MSTTLPAPSDITKQLHERLGSVEQSLSLLREQRAGAARIRDAARSKLAAQESVDIDSPDGREAKRTQEKVRDIDDQIAQAQETQLGILKMLSSDGPAHLKDGLGVSIKMPGAWLWREVRKVLTTDDIGSIEDTGRVFFDRLRERSALLASGVSSIDIVTSELVVPVMTGRIAPAVPTAELDPIAEGDPPIDNVTIKPPKYPKLVTLSLEAYRDARPTVLAATEREVVGSIGEGFDIAAFSGAVASPQVGILNSTGVLTVDATTAWVDLDPFVAAKAQLRTAGAVATAIYMHPLDYEIAGKMKKADNSNEPLVSAALSATGAPAESLLGVPVYQTTGLPRHKVVVAEAAELLVVRRSKIETAVDENFKFDIAGVGFRCIARMSLVLVQPQAVCIISLPAGP
jgi:HK97 family phage major capsid protein